MLNAFPLDVCLLATDLELAKKFYSDQLGLPIIMESPDFVTFQCGGGSRLVITKSTTGTADTQTQALWRVTDIATAINDLHARGVHTDTYGMPGPTDDIADIGFALTTWFVDPFNNSIGLMQLKSDEAART
jgi:predicted enzyme related to lactoylglutathione lyase